MTPLRIGMLAPISHPVPPSGYGPWERVTANLVEELVGLGHAVTLFAAGGSQTSADLVVTAPHPLAGPPPSHPDGGSVEALDPRVWEELHIGTAASAAREGSFDVVHSHLHAHALPFAPLLPCPLLTTLHGAAWNKAVHPLLGAYADQPFVSLSIAERRFFPGLNYVATVHNGIRIDGFAPGPGGGPVVFVGRLAPEKAPDLALAAAETAGVDIVLAGMVEEQHGDFFEQRIRPRLRPNRAEYVGALTAPEVAALYRTASALIMPLRWDEPFGLVVVEALASGTPVVAWRRGAMPELVEDGVTGFLVDSVAEAATAIGRLDAIDRSACRADAERRFGARTMADGYVAAYRKVIATANARRT